MYTYRIICVWEVGSPKVAVILLKDSNLHETLGDLGFNLAEAHGMVEHWRIIQESIYMIYIWSIYDLYMIYIWCIKSIYDLLKGTILEIWRIEDGQIFFVKNWAKSLQMIRTFRTYLQRHQISEDIESNVPWLSHPFEACIITWWSGEDARWWLWTFEI